VTKTGQNRGRYRNIRKKVAKTKPTRDHYRNIRKKAQITIPKELRDYFNIKEGDQVIMRAGKEGIELIPACLIERDRVITAEDVSRGVNQGKEFIKTGKGEVEGPFNDTESLKKTLWTDD